MKKGHIFLMAAFALLAVATGAQAAGLYGSATVTTPVGTINATTTTTATTTVVNGGVTATVNTTTQDNSAAATADLQAVTGTIQTSNPAIVNVETTNDAAVSVTYDRPAKLFGFIATKITEKATVTTDAMGNATVSVEKPWWAFLATSETDSAGLAAAIQTRLDGSATTMNTATVNGQLSASSKAYLLTQIEAAAEATYGVNATY